MRLHPALQVCNGVLHLAHQRKHLGEVRFRRMLAQVEMSRIQDRILALENRVQQTFKFAAPLSGG